MYNKLLLPVIGLSLSILLSLVMLSSSPSDSSLRDRVVLLSSEHGACSGEQVVAPSGKNYILTAAHCLVLAEDGYIKATKENGEVFFARVIEEDNKSDLLLLEGLPNVTGIHVASNSHRFQELRTFTHGHALPTYKTKGSVIGQIHAVIPLSPAETPEEEANCNKPKNKLIDLGFFGKICCLDEVATITDALIVPGSSGGMVVDSDGRLVGVVSAGDGIFGLLVTLQDIQRFLSSY